MALLSLLTTTEQECEMNKPTNGYYVTIVEYDGNNIIKAIGPYTSIRQADKADAGVNRNLNHGEYYTNTAWFGPDIEPTQIQECEMNKLKDESITELVKGIKKDADEILHTCPFCESDRTETNPVNGMYWCNDCQQWDDEGDPGEQSRDEIARDENAVIDKEERP